MNHTPSAVAPLYPELIQVGDAIGQRAQPRGLVQGSVRPTGVVEVLALVQLGHQVPLVPDGATVMPSPAAIITELAAEQRFDTVNIVPEQETSDQIRLFATEVIPLARAATMLSRGIPRGSAGWR